MDIPWKAGEEHPMVQSARPRTEVCSKQRMQFLALTTDQMADSALLTDLEFKVWYVNRAFSEIYGYHPDEIIGRAPTMLNAESDAEAIQNDIYRTVSIHQVWRGEVLNRRKDGTLFPCEVTVFPLAGADGNIYGYGGIQRDISERRQAQEALRLARENLEARVEERTQALIEANENLRREIEERRRIEERLRIYERLVESSEDRMVIVDNGYVYRLSNEAHWRAHGRTREEVVGRHAAEVAGLDFFRSTIQPTLDRVLAGESFQTTVRQDYAHAGKRYLHVTCYPIQDTSKEITAVASVMRDITEQKEAEERLYRQGQALEQALDGIAIADMEGIIQFVNHAWAAMHGYTPEELLGKHLGVFHSPSQMDHEVIPFNKIVFERGGHFEEVGHCRKDGTPFRTRMSSSLLRDETGTPSGIIGIARDISRELEIEAQLRHGQKMEAIGVLAGGMAHNLRNTLASALGWIEIGRTRVKDSKVLHTSLDRAEKACRRAEDQIAQLLTFSRKAKSVRIPIRLAPVIEEAENLLQGFLPASVKVERRIHPGCSPVNADADQIQQVLLNLASNASDAMKGEGTIEILLEPARISCEEAANCIALREGDYVRLVVRDTGHGIERDALQRIFEPFFTTKPPGKGTGLGLSIVHGIVENHCGAVEVESEPGQGTSVSVLFPACPQEEVAATVSEEREFRSPRPAAQRILLVDDDADFSEMVHMGLSLLGYRVELHGDAKAALEAFESNPSGYDVLVTDLVMPRLSGLEVADRAHRLRPDLPKILISGMGEHVDKQAAGLAGIQEQLTKPVTPYELSIVIERIFPEA